MDIFNYNNRNSFENDSHSGRQDYLDDKPNPKALYTMIGVESVFTILILAVAVPFIINISQDTSTILRSLIPILILVLMTIGISIIFIINFMNRFSEYISFDGLRMMVTLHKGKNKQEFYINESYEVDIAMVPYKRSSVIALALRSPDKLLFTHHLHVNPSLVSPNSRSYEEIYRDVIASWKQMFLSHGIKVNNAALPDAYMPREQSFQDNIYASYQSSQKMQEDASYVRAHNKKTFIISLSILSLIMLGMGLFIFFTTMYGKQLDTISLILDIIIIAINILLPIIYGIITGLSVKKTNSLSDADLLNTPSAKSILEKRNQNKK